MLQLWHEAAQKKTAQPDYSSTWSTQDCSLPSVELCPVHFKDPQMRANHLPIEDYSTDNSSFTKILSL